MECRLVHCPEVSVATLKRGVCEDPLAYNQFSKYYTTLKKAVVASRLVPDFRFKYFASNIEQKETPFFNRSALLLQDLDSHLEGQLTQGVQNVAHFCDRNVGGMLEYVLARCGWYCNALVCFLREQHPLNTSKWNKFCPTHRVQILKGINGNTDLLMKNNRNYFAQFVSDSPHFIAHGLDLVLAEGLDFPLSDQTFARNANSDEWSYLPVLVAQILTALPALVNGGRLVLKILHVFMPSTVEALFVTSLCFEHVCLYRPAACPAGSSDSYFVAFGFRAHLCQDALSFLENRLSTSPWEPILDMSVWETPAGMWFKNTVLHQAEIGFKIQAAYLQTLVDDSLDEYLLVANKFYGGTKPLKLKGFAYDRPVSLPEISYQCCVQFLKSMEHHANANDILMAALVPETLSGPVKFLFCGANFVSEIRPSEARGKVAAAELQRLWSHVIAPGTVARIRMVGLHDITILQIVATLEEPMLWKRSTCEDHRVGMRLKYLPVQDNVKLTEELEQNSFL